MNSNEDRVNQYLQANDLQGAFECIQGFIRQEPTVAEHRWALFQLLCVQRQWDKALKQLQVYATLDAASSSDAYTVRMLIQCEQLRHNVFMGRAQPGFVFDAAPWMKDLLEANRLNLAGDHASADTYRYRSFAQISDMQGVINGQPFSWISDKDSRLGPVLELYSVGAYRWCSFKDIVALQFESPKTLLDIIWRKVRCELVDSTILYAYIPTHYVTDLDQEIMTSSQLLARETVWTESGETLVQGKGQRIWMTDTEQEFSILDCQELVIYKEVVDGKS